MIDLPTTFSVIITILILSVLFKNTPLFRLGTAIWIGASVGYLSTEGLRNIWGKCLVPISTGDVAQIVPLVLGALLFFRYAGRYSFIARYPSAITLGAGSGAMIAGLAITQIYQQALSTATITSIDTAIIAAWVILIFLYFTMTFIHRGPLGHASTAGRWLLMITFGLGLANYATGRFNQVISRFQLIYYTWLGLG